MASRCHFPSASDRGIVSTANNSCGDELLENEEELEDDDDDDER